MKWPLRRERPARASSAAPAASELSRQIAEQESITSVLITQAQAEVAATLSNADSHDNKALGLLALDVVIAGGLIANRDSLDRFWYAP